jgi:uncharacterized protein
MAIRHLTNSHLANYNSSISNHVRYKMSNEYFPLGMASGKYFCNREVERARLAKNIRGHLHTLITSPRRYGKSSLVVYVLEEEKIPYAKIDLFVALDAVALEEQLLHGIGELLTKLSSKPAKIINELKEFLQNSQWTIGFKGVSISLIPPGSRDATVSIKESLLILENFLAKKKKHAVLFIDEFQEIGALPGAKAIEGAIRHVAQQTKYLLFVFSGSNRHLLANMFDDRSRPLYLLCDRIILGRIDEHHYKIFFNGFAKHLWQQPLTDEVLQAIFITAERHPYYTNVLCNYLWKKYENGNETPALASVAECWQEYIKIEKDRVIRELSVLNFSQRKVLTAIAFGFSHEFTGKVFLNKVDLAGSSVHKALEVLEEKDFIGISDIGNYFIIDPLIKAALLFYYNDGVRTYS